MCIRPARAEANVTGCNLFKSWLTVPESHNIHYLRLSSNTEGTVRVVHVSTRQHVVKLKGVLRWLPFCWLRRAVACRLMLSLWSKLDLDAFGYD